MRVEVCFDNLVSTSTPQGLHVDVGCSELLLSHAIKVVSKCEPKSFEPGRLCLDNGESIETDAVIFATGIFRLSILPRRFLEATKLTIDYGRL